MVTSKGTLDTNIIRTMNSRHLPGEPFVAFLRRPAGDVLAAVRRGDVETVVLTQHAVVHGLDLRVPCRHVHRLHGARVGQQRLMGP